LALFIAVPAAVAVSGSGSRRRAFVVAIALVQMVPAEALILALRISTVGS
jgi:hypothetical protein